MFNYLIRRLLILLITVVGAMAVLFLVLKLIPGEPATVMLGPRATPEMIQNIRDRLLLDEPLYVQLGQFLLKSLQGDLGRDVLNNRPVVTIIFEALPYTIVLALSSIALACLIGIPLGAYAASRRGSFVDQFTGFLSVSMITVPPFVAGLLLLLVFSLQLRWFPVTGAGAPGNLLDQLYHLVLPVVALALSWIGYIARLVRTSVLEEIGKDHVRTAHSKGLSAQRVLFRHVLRGALVPTIAVLGVGFGNLLGGAVLTEIIFSRPGLGFLIFNAIESRNFPIVQGGLIIAVFLYAITNLLADLSYAAIDPRIRLG